MFLRTDTLPIALPRPKEPACYAAAPLQDLPGGKNGEMSTLGTICFRALISGASRSFNHSTAWWWA